MRRPLQSGQVDADPPVDSVVARRAAAPDTTPARIPLVPTPTPVRGLYVNRWAALGQRMVPPSLVDISRGSAKASAMGSVKVWAPALARESGWADL